MATWTWIGLWRSESAPDWPDPEDLVDPNWDVEERTLVATHLREGMGSPAIDIRTLRDGTVEIGSRCRLCEDDAGDSTGFDTDGTYAWPDNLDHYVETHSVRAPLARGRSHP